VKNADLIRRVKAAPASSADLKEYARRVSRRVNADYCEYRHHGCALVPGGPCLDEVLGRAEHLEVAVQESMAECEYNASVGR
jgi:hypothetical protein